MKIECSARHIHLSQKDALQLGIAELTPAAELSIRGQFLSKERARITGGSAYLGDVAIVGPFRAQSVVEVSQSDARKLGIAPEVNTPRDDCSVVVTHAGMSVRVPVVIAMRHVHVPERYARFFAIGAALVRVLSPRGDSTLTCTVRLADCAEPVLHLDTDEFNGLMPARAFFVDDLC